MQGVNVLLYLLEGRLDIEEAPALHRKPWKFVKEEQGFGGGMEGPGSTNCLAIQSPGNQCPLRGAREMDEVMNWHCDMNDVSRSDR